MNTFFANVDLFDPTGADRMAEGDVYGGETRLFVLKAATLEAALRTLTAAVATQGSRIDRVHKAAATQEFTSDGFPFDVDIAAMTKDAIEQDEICVTPDYTFSPYGNNETRLFYGLFDYADPSRDQPYAGEFCHAARRADSCGDALIAILDDLSGNGCTLKSVEDFSDAGFFDRSIEVQSGSLGDLIASDIDTVVWSTGSTIYASDDDD